MTRSVIALASALSRLAENAWMVALTQRLGHYPSKDEMSAELDRFELHKIEQHAAEAEGED